MPLRSLLHHLTDDPGAATLARDGGRAFASASLRPYVLAALADEDPGRAALVVAGDDRQARDLAADLRAWLHPRPVRFYPSRGVAYESHLAPPPHLVGLRVAALDALLADSRATGRGRRRRSSSCPPSRSARRSPTRACARTPSRCASATCSTSTSACAELVAAGYERVDQVEDRGQFAVRGGLLDIYPATEDRAVRVDLFDIEIESLRWFSTFTQRSLGETTEVEIAPAAELAAEHRELAEIAALESRRRRGPRPDIAELLPVDRFRAFLDLAPDAAVLLAAEEELEPGARRPLAGRLRRLPRRRRPPPLRRARRDHRRARRARPRAPVLATTPTSRVEFRAQAADLAARSLKEAEPELEKLVRSGYRTVVAWPQRGEGERAAYNLAPPAGVVAGGGRSGGHREPAALRPRPPARRLHRRRA